MGRAGGLKNSRASGIVPGSTVGTRTIQGRVQVMLDGLSMLTYHSWRIGYSKENVRCSSPLTNICCLLRRVLCPQNPTPFRP